MLETYNFLRYLSTQNAYMKRFSIGNPELIRLCRNNINRVHILCDIIMQIRIRCRFHKINTYRSIFKILELREIEPSDFLHFVKDYCTNAKTVFIANNSDLMFLTYSFINYGSC